MEDKKHILTVINKLMDSTIFSNLPKISKLLIKNGYKCNLETNNWDYKFEGIKLKTKNPTIAKRIVKLLRKNSYNVQCKGSNVIEI